MVSRENNVITVFVCLALALAFGLQASTVGLTDTQRGAILLGIGVVVPLAINEYLDSRESD